MSSGSETELKESEFAVNHSRLRWLFLILIVGYDSHNVVVIVVWESENVNKDLGITDEVRNRDAPNTNPVKPKSNSSFGFEKTWSGFYGTGPGLTWFDRDLSEFACVSLNFTRLDVDMILYDLNLSGSILIWLDMTRQSQVWQDLTRSDQILAELHWMWQDLTMFDPDSTEKCQKKRCLAYCLPYGWGSRTIECRCTGLLQSSWPLISFVHSAAVREVHPLISSIHCLLCLPLLLLLWTNLYTMWVHRFCALISCPKYCSFLLFIISRIFLSVPISLRMESLVRCAFQLILSICRSDDISKACSLLLSAALRVQDSQPYTTTDYTIVFSIFKLMVLLSARSFQTMVRDLKADLVARNRAPIS